jgi:hypothetical protein
LPAHLVARLDHDASAEQQQMRQFEQVRQYRRRLRPGNEGGRIGLERRRRVGLGKGAVERMGAGAIAAQHRLPHAVGIDQHAGLGVALAGAFCDDRRDGLVCEIRGDAVRLQQALGVGLADETGGAERAWEGRLHAEGNLSKSVCARSRAIMRAASSV